MFQWLSLPVARRRWLCCSWSLWSVFMKICILRVTLSCRVVASVYSASHVHFFYSAALLTGLCTSVHVIVGQLVCCGLVLPTLVTGTHDNDLFLVYCTCGLYHVICRQLAIPVLASVDLYYGFCMWLVGTTYYQLACWWQVWWAKI